MYRSLCKLLIQFDTFLSPGSGACTQAPPGGWGWSGYLFTEVFSTHRMLHSWNPHEISKRKLWTGAMLALERFGQIPSKVEIRGGMGGGGGPGEGVQVRGVQGRGKPIFEGFKVFFSQRGRAIFFRGGGHATWVMEDSRSRLVVVPNSSPSNGAVVWVWLVPRPAPQSLTPCRGK